MKTIKSWNLIFKFFLRETIEGLQKDKGSTGPPFTAKVSSTQNNPPITTPNSVFCMHDVITFEKFKLSVIYLLLVDFK